MAHTFVLIVPLQALDQIGFGGFCSAQGCTLAQLKPACRSMISATDECMVGRAGLWFPFFQRKGHVQFMPGHSNYRPLHWGKLSLVLTLQICVCVWGGRGGWLLQTPPPHIAERNEVCSLVL